MYPEKTCPGTILETTNHKYIYVELNSGRCGKKQATNRISYSKVTTS